MKPGVIVLWPIKIGAGESRKNPFTLKGMKSFFTEGESIKQEVGYAGEIT